MVIAGNLICKQGIKSSEIAKNIHWIEGRFLSFYLTNLGKHKGANYKFQII